ncbi:MAG: PEP-CTERM sorting domain-containing protein [Deltaproteobacteria bacterium]|nr:PEP-CTERM sorting domain-containing protein [Deltaproteobacteria bacterium]
MKMKRYLNVKGSSVGEKTMKKTLFYLILVCALFLIDPAMATTINIPRTDGFGVISQTNYSYGQTFMLQSGDDTQLDAAAFYFNKNSAAGANVTVKLSLYETADFDPYNPNSNLLFSQNIEVDYFLTNCTKYKLYSFGITGVDLAIGTQYSWWATWVSGGSANIGANKDGYYPYGIAQYYRNTELIIRDFSQYGDYDLALSMELSPSSAPPPMPEPATMLLLGLGIVGLAEVRRKIKK